MIEKKKNSASIITQAVRDRLRKLKFQCKMRLFPKTFFPLHNTISQHFSWIFMSASGLMVRWLVGVCLDQINRYERINHRKSRVTVEMRLPFTGGGVVSGTAAYTRQTSQTAMPTLLRETQSKPKSRTFFLKVPRMIWFKSKLISLMHTREPSISNYIFDSRIIIKFQNRSEYVKLKLEQQQQ